MSGLINIIRDNFSAFIEAMLLIPSRFQIWYFSEVVMLVIILSLALGVVLLCARWMKKYNLGFTASVLLAFLVLSLTLGLTGLLLSIPLLYIRFDTFLVLCIGSPVFNLVLGVIASLGNRLRSNQPIAGALLLCAAGFLFAYVLFTAIIMFAFRLYN